MLQKRQWRICIYHHVNDISRLSNESDAFNHNKHDHQSRLSRALFAGVLTYPGPLFVRKVRTCKKVYPSYSYTYLKIERRGGERHRTWGIATSRRPYPRLSFPPSLFAVSITARPDLYLLHKYSMFSFSHSLLGSRFCHSLHPWIILDCNLSSSPLPRAFRVLKQCQQLTEPFATIALISI